MSLSLLSHAAHVFGQGASFSPSLNALLMTLVGLAAMSVWATEAGQ